MGEQRIAVRGRFCDLLVRNVTVRAGLVLHHDRNAELVSELSQKAFALGARKVGDLEENEFMVSWGFEDLDGHLWDLFWFRS